MNFEALEQIVINTRNGEYKNIGRLVRKAIKEGIPKQDIVKALSEGLISVSQKYKSEGMYLDDVVMAAAAFELGVRLLPFEEEEEKDPFTRVVIGVMGGPWSIGSSIVAANLKANGFEVIDAGSDVTPEKIAKTTLESDARLVASAIYLTHNAKQIAQLEEALWNNGVRNKIRTLISGPATSPKLAESLNVDAYAKEVMDVVAKLKVLSKELRDEMTPKARVMTSLKHKEPDRVPFMPFAQTFCAKFAGIPFSKYVSNAEAMAEGQIKAYKFFGWDATCFSSDVGMYSEACGAKCEFPLDDVPRIVKPALTPGNIYKDFKNLKMPDPHKGRLGESIKAIQIVKKTLGPDVPAIGWTEGPFQGVSLLAGADPMTIFFVKEHPDEFKEIIDWYVDYEVAVAQAMLEAGADLIGSGETAAYFMSPKFFKEFVLEPEKKAYSRINKLGLPVLIHCCGYVPQCIHFAMESNPGGAIQFDYQVDLNWAKQLIGDKVTIMGNLNYNALVEGSIEKSYESAASAIKTAGKGGGFWLAFGCEIPRDLPINNMRSILRAAKTVGKYPIQ